MIGFGLRLYIGVGSRDAVGKWANSMLGTSIKPKGRRLEPGHSSEEAAVTHSGQEVCGWQCPGSVCALSLSLMLSEGSEVLLRLNGEQSGLAVMPGQLLSARAAVHSFLLTLKPFGLTTVSL